MMKLEVKNASVGYNKKIVLQNISFSVSTSEIVCLLGANGVGKTTLFKTILGFQKPIKGDVLIDGVSRNVISNKDFAKLVAYVPQSHELSFSYPVLDVIVMGCTVNMDGFHTPGRKEYLLAKNILHYLGVGYLSDKLFSKISGGEKQMVLIARALAQKPSILLMDEPTANLDYGNQVRVIGLIKKLRNHGIGILFTTHNPEHAFWSANKAVLISNDGTIYAGGVSNVITEECLSSSYGVSVKIIETTTEDGKRIKVCAPLVV